MFSKILRYTLVGLFVFTLVGQACLQFPDPRGLVCNSDDQCGILRCIQNICTDKVTPTEGVSSETSKEVAPQEEPSEPVKESKEDSPEEPASESDDAGQVDPEKAPENVVSPESEPANESTRETRPERPQDVSSGDEQTVTPEPKPDTPVTQKNWVSATEMTGPLIDDNVSPHFAQDSKGNIYIAGTFLSPIKMGTCSVAPKGSHEIFVGKFDPQGKCLWMNRAGGTSHDEGSGVVVDSQDNVLITGTFSGVGDFGSTTLAFNGNRDVFLAKLDSNGNWQWVKQAGDLGENGKGGIAIDSKDNIYLSGTYTADSKVGSFTIKYNGSYRNTWILKANSNGIWQWAKSINGYSIHGTMVTVDKQDNLYIAGHGGGQIKFDNVQTGKISGNVFVLSLDPTGKARWIAWEKSATGGGSTRASKIIPDSKGNILLVGNYLDQASFGSTHLPYSATSRSRQAYVAKLSNQGKWLWAKAIASPFNERLLGVTVDQQDNVYVTGFFEGIITLAGTNLKSAGDTDVLVAGLDSSGNWLWALQGGSTGIDRGSDLYVTQQGDLFVTGKFGGKGSFGSINFQSTASRNMFLAKVR